MPNSGGKFPEQIPTAYRYGKFPRQENMANPHGKKPRWIPTANSHYKYMRMSTNNATFNTSCNKRSLMFYVLTYVKQMWTPAKSQVLSTKGIIIWWFLFFFLLQRVNRVNCHGTEVIFLRRKPKYIGNK